MPRWLRVSIGVTISLIIIIIVGGAIFYHMLKSSLPVYDGKLESGFVKNNVQIYRDSMGVPYIISKDENDAAFALGYVHAQERLFSMDLMRRAGQGRLSEIFGSSAITI